MKPKFEERTIVIIDIKRRSKKMKYIINKDPKGPLYITEEEMKLNYNCPADQKSGEGPGSCGGANGEKASGGSKDSKQRESENKKAINAGGTSGKSPSTKPKMDYEKYSDAGVFDEDKAEQLYDADITPEMLSEKSDESEGIGEYKGTYGYKFANGDLSLSDLKKKFNVN